MSPPNEGGGGDQWVDDLTPEVELLVWEQLRNEGLPHTRISLTAPRARRVARRHFGAVVSRGS